MCNIFPITLHYTGAAKAVEHVVIYVGIQQLNPFGALKGELGIN